MLSTVVFLNGTLASRGNLYSDIHVEDKEQFLRRIEAWNERVGTESPFYSYPSCMYAFLNGLAAASLNVMTVKEFEYIFNSEDIQRLGRLLEYGGPYNKWPVFNREIYLKYGYEYKGDVAAQ